MQNMLEKSKMKRSSGKLSWSIRGTPMGKLRDKSKMKRGGY